MEVHQAAEAPDAPAEPVRIHPHKHKAEVKGDAQGSALR